MPLCVALLSFQGFPELWLFGCSDVRAIFTINTSQQYVAQYEAYRAGRDRQAGKEQVFRVGKQPAYTGDETDAAAATDYGVAGKVEEDADDEVAVAKKERENPRRRALKEKSEALLRVQRLKRRNQIPGPAQVKPPEDTGEIARW